MQADWARVRELFRRAREAPPERRRALVLEESAGDDALAREVLSLLAAAEGEDSLLEPPDPDAARALLAGAEGADLPAGARVGGFRLVRPLAAGGMGVVHEAEQERPRRRVALKVLRLGLAGEHAARRFRYEAEVLARLVHPGIAQVLAAGVERVPTAGGERELPWLAMELVEGAETILGHAQRAGLDARARVALLREVCAAVHHGHVKGVVHRDLKPANVLVGADGRPKVIDFGVARVAGAEAELSTMHTRAGALLGTLAYMSPEQLGGDADAVDVRSDVYALGVLAHELLAGELPYDVAGKPVHVVARIVREAAPRAAGVDADLDVVIRKALEKEPERRYASAAAFADDLGRWLAGEPPLARPPNALYQARVLARRHKALVAAGAAIVAVSVAAAVGSARAAGRARAAEEAAVRRLDQGRELARALLGDVLGAIEGLPGATKARAELARTATDYLDGLADEAREDPELALEIARGFRRLAEVVGHPTRASLGESAAALAAYGRAEALLARLPADDPRARAERVRTALGHGELELRSGAGDAALARAERTADEARALADGSRAGPDDADDLLALALHHLGRVRLRRGDEGGASLLEEVLARAAGRDDASALALRARAHAELAAHHQRRRAWEAAEEHHAAQVELHRRLAAERPDDVELRLDLGDALAGRAALAQERGDLAGALATLDEALALAASVAAADPADAAALAAVARARAARGMALDGLGDLEAALDAFRASLADTLELARRDPTQLEWRRLAGAREAAVALTLFRLGRPEEAQGPARSALARLEQAHAADPGDVETARELCLAADVASQVLLETGVLEEAAAAVASYEEAALALAARQPGDAWIARQVVLLLDRRGMVARAEGEREERPAAERAAAHRRAAAAFRECVAAVDDLFARGLANPGDEEARAAVAASIEACEAEALRLSGL